MQACSQSTTQSVYQHGISVRDHMLQLIQSLHDNQPLQNWRLPEWLFQYREQIINKLLPLEIIEEYTLFHDCSKPYCKVVDQEGKTHFPNHAELSGKLWLEMGGRPEAAILMSMDMDIHKIKAVDVEEFAKRPQAITLLLAGLSEIHSNAQMFGGINSDSFKIKWKHLDKRGKAICQKLFNKET